MQIYDILQETELHISCLLLKLKKRPDCITKFKRVMIFAAIETLQYIVQYIVVRPTDCKMKDRFIYRNKNLTIKFPSQAAFLEKCACLLSAIILKDTGFVPTTIYGGRLSVIDLSK
jgi:hypothetical protein